MIYSVTHRPHERIHRFLESMTVTDLSGHTWIVINAVHGIYTIFEGPKELIPPYFNVYKLDNEGGSACKVKNNNCTFRPRSEIMQGDVLTSLIYNLIVKHIGEKTTSEVWLMIEHSFFLRFLDSPVILTSEVCEEV